MKIYTYHFPINSYTTEAVGRYIPADASFLDIETTGLKRSSSIIYMIGAAYFVETELHILQWFNDDAVSEEAILKAYLAELRKHPGPVITFNGDGFDLPFLKEHMGYNEMDDTVLSDRESLDLYRRLRNYAPICDRKHSSQRDWEEYLGIHRQDPYQGGKLIPVYKKYLKYGDPQALEQLLLHNMEDLRYLTALPALLAYDQLKEAAYQLTEIEESTYADQTAIRFTIRCHAPLPGDFSLVLEEGRINLLGQDLLQITLAVKEGILYHYYPDYRNYCYLPSEDRAVHKSIAAYVDKAHRIPCRPENCYMPLDSIFLPLPAAEATYGFSSDPSILPCPIYKTAYDSKESYLSFDDLFVQDAVTDRTKDYLHIVLQSMFIRKIRKTKS